jgi:lysophospholipase L1-like esterase
VQRIVNFTSPSQVPPQPGSSRRRKWAFRLAAVALGLSVFAAVEGVCMLGGWGRPADYPDPYVGFSEVHPLFVLDDAGTRYRIPRSRRDFFAKESFPAVKEPKTFRIFCLGGSTVQGRPYSTPTSFPRWLQLSLNAGDDSRDWEAVNCGGISYASYRLVPILKECLQYEPDLFVICTGHNEFLEDRTYSHIKHAPGYAAVPMRRLSRLRTVTLLRSLISRARGKSDVAPDDRPVLPADTSPLLDVENNQLQAYHRDDEWHAGVVEHFEFNLRRMIDIAAAAEVPVVLVLPPSDLRDSPPFKSETTSGLDAAAASRFRSLVERGRTTARSDLKKAIAALEEVVRIDGRHAGTWYLLGRCYDAHWRKTLDDRYRDKARAAYVRARDEDVCPLRMVSPLEEVMRRVAAETETPLIDAHALLEAKCPDGILGRQFLVDHIHPSPVKGHQAIAHALADLLKSRGTFHPSDNWERDRAASFRRYLSELRRRDESYFLRGERTLRALRAWTKGLAEKPSLDPGVPKRPLKPN